MTVFTNRQGAICLAGMLAWSSVVLAEPAPVVGNPAADRLWQSFIEQYNHFSLNPLDAKTLDEKARAALIRTAGPKFRSWKPERQPSFPQLADAIMAEDDSMPEFDRVERALTALLPEIDIYGHYKPAAAIAQWTEALRQNPGTVHLTLDQAPDGRILCYPMAEGPAEVGGVNPGAQLLEVDKRPVAGKGIDSLRLTFVGPPNSQVALKIKQPQGKIEDLTLTRTDKEAPIVTTTKTPLGVTVRVRKFDKETALTIQRQLEVYPHPGRLTLDLRGNSGGLREEALLTAALFFPEGTPIGKFTTRKGVQTATDRDGIAVEPTAIQVLQDRRTASAAEYLIATLKEGLPDKVTLFGKTTYGKSHSTARVMLEGGGELAVTEALLATASGRSWDKTGIEPDHADKE
ncbi:MAG: S41 family peptidase [Verrucomicrobiota bacterium]